MQSHKHTLFAFALLFALFALTEAAHASSYLACNYIIEITKLPKDLDCKGSCAKKIGFKILKAHDRRRGFCRLAPKKGQTPTAQERTLGVSDKNTLKGIKVGAKRMLHHVIIFPRPRRGAPRRRFIRWQLYPVPAKKQAPAKKKAPAKK